jgi:Basic region leucine zipper
MHKPDQIAIRKERNKRAAARSRANRKASYQKMEQEIETLRLENAALQVQINSLLSRNMVEPFAYIEQTAWVDQMQIIMSSEQGGFKEENVEAISENEKSSLHESPTDIVSPRQMDSSNTQQEFSEFIKLLE